jgi:hypothetical protein
MKALVISFVVGLLVGCIWGHSREESRAACRCSTWAVGDGIRRASWRMVCYEEDPNYKRGFRSRC